MHVAIVLHNDVLTDASRQQAIIESLQRSKGVTKLDLDIIESGLILANLQQFHDMEHLNDLDRVLTVETMDSQSINI